MIIKFNIILNIKEQIIEVHTREREKRGMHWSGSAIYFDEHGDKNHTHVFG